MPGDLTYMPRNLMRKKQRPEVKDIKKATNVVERSAGDLAGQSQATQGIPCGGHVMSAPDDVRHSRGSSNASAM